MNISIVYAGCLNNLTDYIEHARNMANEGHNVSLYAREINRDLFPNSKTFEIGPATKIQTIDRAVFYIRAARLISKTNTQHAICSYGRGALLFGFLMAIFRLIGSWRGTTYYDLRSGSVSGKLDRLKDFAHRIESKFFDRKIVITRKVGEYVLGLKGDNFLELDVGVKHKAEIPNESARIIREQLGITEKNYVITYSGTFNNRKLDVFFSRITSIPENVVFILIGDGTPSAEESIKRAIASKYIADQVIFTGRIPYDELPLFYSISDAGLCHIPPDAMYQFQPPTKLYEYLEYGVAIITTSTPAANEILNKNPSYPFHTLQNNGDINIELIIKDLDQKKLSWPAERRATVKYWEDLTKELVEFLSRFCTKNPNG